MMKQKTETTNIGILELGNLTFDEDRIEVSIDICDMSDNLRSEINKAVEIAKINYIKEKEEMNKKYNYNLPIIWSDKPVIIDFIYLQVVLEAGKTTTYTICVGFHDADNSYMEQWNCDIKVDLSAYDRELKKTILKILIEKFF